MIEEKLKEMDHTDYENKFDIIWIYVDFTINIIPKRKVDSQIIEIKALSFFLFHFISFNNKLSLIYFSSSSNKMGRKN
jgi:hypothetical protein